MQTLTAAVDDASAGRGGTVFLTGDLGVGKSRLARETAELASSRGFEILTGRAVESAVPVPYRPIAEALMRLARCRHVPGAQDFADYRPALGSLVPEWSRAGDDAAEISPVILGEAVLRVLTQREATGTLLILEDLHWADPETLAIIEYLADNLGGTRVLCLATLRGEPSEGLLLARSATARRVAITVEVPRLTGKAVARMAAACLGTDEPPAWVTGRILANCDGLPFAVEELLAAAVSSGELTRGTTGWQVNDQITTGLPDSLVGSVWNRLAGLGRPAAEIVIYAAVLGKRFDWTLLPSLAGTAERDVLAALRQAHEAQLIKPVAADCCTFEFRHSLTRSAIVSGLLPPDLARRSASAAAAIEAAHPGLPGPWCERAAELHAAAGTLVRAARLQLEAGRRAHRMGALSSAIASLRDASALAAAAQPPAPALCLEIDESLVPALSLAGDYSQLAPLAEDLIGRLDAAGTDARREAQVRITIAGARCEDHYCPSAEAHLARAREIAETLHDPALASQVDAAAAQCAMAAGELDVADDLAHRSLSIAEAAVKEPWAAVVAVDALQVIGRRERLRDFAAAEDVFQRAYRIATDNGLAIARIGTLHELGTIDMLRDSKTDRLFEARDLAQQAGAISTVGVIDLQLAHALTHGTDLDRALACALRCEQGARLLGARRLEAFALCSQAIIRAVQADRRAAECAAERAERILPGDQELLLSTWGTARVTASLFLDDPVRALRESVAGMAHGGHLALTLPRRAWSYYALLHVVHDKNAYEAVKQARDAGAAAGWSQGYLAYADAVLAGREGQPERATELAEAGAAYLAPYAPRWTHLAHRLVAADAIKDGWGEPVAWLRAAAAEFEAGGYAHLASTCRGLLRRSGARVPRCGRGNAPVPVQMSRLGVTSREMDVFLLVARGLSNAERAERLVMSPKTVETHVASLIAKMGQAGRRQLVAHAARLVRLAHRCALNSGPRRPKVRMLPMRPAPLLGQPFRMESLPQAPDGHQTGEFKRRFEEQAVPLMAVLYPAALRLTKQRCDAEDLLQETFTRAYLKFHQFTPGTNLRAWLCRILLTTFYSSCRRRGRAPAEILSPNAWDPAEDRVRGLGQPCRSAESEAIDNLAGSFVMQALGDLPAQYKAAIYLADIHGYQGHEIAQMLGTPLGTVSSRIHRGREMLRVRISRNLSSGRKIPAPPVARRCAATAG